MGEGLKHPPLSQAARAPAAVEVAHSSRTDNRAGAQGSRACGMGDELSKIERHILAGIGRAEGLAVELGLQGQVHAATPKRAA